MDSATTGICQEDQPSAGAILTVGIRVLFGGGNTGSGPCPFITGSVADSPQPASSRAQKKISDTLRLHSGATGMLFVIRMLQELRSCLLQSAADISTSRRFKGKSLITIILFAKEFSLFYTG